MGGLYINCTNCEIKDKTGLLSAAQSGRGHWKRVHVLIKAEADVNSSLFPDGMGSVGLSLHLRPEEF